VKYAVIGEKAGKISVTQACRLLNARRQGFYEWMRRHDTPRAQQDRLLTNQIKNIFYESKRIYGARKIQALLRKNWKVSRKRIRRLMLCAGLVPNTYRRHVNTTDSRTTQMIFPNLLKQNFHVESLNRVWVSDMTYIPTDEGWLYLCSMLDLCSRRVVGWAVSKTIDRHLAISALNNAVKNRCPDKGLILHTDRGCQYASGDFRKAVADMGGIQSMSRAGNPYDNACAETFFKSLKMECLSYMHFDTRYKALRAVEEYLLFYNRVRIHATLGYLSPVDFELGLPFFSVAS
jgi:putative transposase